MEEGEGFLTEEAARIHIILSPLPGRHTPRGTGYVFKCTDLFQGRRVCNLQTECADEGRAGGCNLGMECVQTGAALGAKTPLKFSECPTQEAQ